MCVPIRSHCSNLVYFWKRVAQLDKEASQTRDYCAAKSATRRAARPDSSLREERLFGMTSKIEKRPNVSSQSHFVFSVSELAVGDARAKRDI
jgi:hypothetical protein